MNFQSVRMGQPVASVTRDGNFAYFQVGCGHVTCRREGNRIVLIAGPDCQLAASGGLDIRSRPLTFQLSWLAHRCPHANSSTITFAQYVMAVRG